MLVGEVANHNAQQMQRSLRAMRPKDDDRSIGIRIPELSAENVRRHAERAAGEIQGITSSVADRMAATVEKAVSQGLRGEALTSEIQRQLGLARDQAKRVAVGQVIRINAAITRERHEKLGITRYKWRSTDDAHTRRWHRALNGTIQSYDAPPEGGGGGPHDHGNPGSADTCRCQAIPVVDDPDQLTAPAENDNATASSEPFASKEAFDAHVASRGFEPVEPEAYAELRKVLGAKLSPRDLDALSGHTELSTVAGERTVSLRKLQRGGVRFETLIDVEGTTDRIGLTRTFGKVNTPKGKQLVAIHNHMLLPENLQGKGIGRRVLAAQVQAYERLGVKQVRLDAEWIGRYYWPKLGFNVHQDEIPGWVSQFQDFLIGKKLPRATVEAVTKDISSLRDIATTMVGDRKLGKEFLLQGPGIEDLSIDVGSPEYARMKKELGVTETAGVRKAKPRKPRAKRSAA